MSKNSIRRILFVTSLAYLFVTLSFTILPIDLVPELNALTLQQTLVICFCTAIAADITCFYPYKHRWVSFVIPYVTIAGCVFFIGSVLLNIIPYDIHVYASILLTVLFVYVVCYYAIYEKNKNDANVMNKKLQRKDKGVM